MTAATQTAAPAMICTKPDRSIALPCPCCGEPSASISVCLNLLGPDDEAFTCGDCETAFSRAAVEEFVAKWTKVLKWLDAVPTFDAE